MHYDEAFDAVLRARHDLLGLEEIEAAERGRQGRLLRDDQDCYAIVDAFRNHRCHTDAFALALEELREFFPEELRELTGGPSLCVVDIGAGAGNVAAAFCETGQAGAAGRLAYIGVEPHDMMRRLGIAFLRELAADRLQFRFFESCSGVPIPEADRYLVTLNYVVQQPGVSDDDLEQWAALVAKLHSMGPTCIASVSVNSISPRLAAIDCSDAFVRKLTLSGLSFDTHSTTRRMDRRMPRADGKGWVLQPARGEDWPNLRIRLHRLRDAAVDGE